MEHSQTCPRCLEQDTLRQRSFSDQALAALLIWEEVDDHHVNQPMCTSCYEELREVLIERAGELENASKQPRPAPRAPSHRPAAMKVKKAEAPAPKPAVAAKPAGKPVVAAAKPAAAKPAAAKPTAKAPVKTPAKPTPKKKPDETEKTKAKPATKKKKTSKAS